MGWKMEVGKMGMYIMFPVAMFHWFNQPENFEKWVIEYQKATFPPQSRAQQAFIEETIEKINEERDKRILNELQEE